MLSGEFRPKNLPRRGEMIAWSMTLLLAAFWAWLSWRGFRVLPVVPGSTWLLGVVAVLISFSNWVERSTRLVLDEEGIFFSNGLRRVRLTWDEIEKIRLHRATLGNGQTVEVLGQRGHFHFDTLGTAAAAGRPAVEIGFVEGEEILNTLISRCGFRRYEDGKNGVYYAP